ncbi:MAG: FtsX-like permease family protein, partial [Gemmatimonadaceae bacterium]
GVLPPDFQFITNADLYFPHERGPGTVRSAHNYLVIGRRGPGVTLDAARADMTTLSHRLHDEYGNDTQAVDADVRPLRDYLVSNFRAILAAVLGSAAMVLLIACVNLLSAQLARAWAREREIAVRAALGASRHRLVRQLCLESAVLVVAGSTLGIGLAFALTAAIKRLGVGLVPRLIEVSIDGRVLAFVAGAAALTVLVVGLYPALRLSRGGAAGLLRASRGTAGTVRSSLWRALVGFEIALAMMLTVGSALLVRTLHNILTAPTGLYISGVVYASFSPAEGDLARLDDIGAELSRLPGASGAAFTTELPFNWGDQSAPVRRPGDPIDHDWLAFAGFRLVTPGYFDLLHEHVRIGRAFGTGDRAGALPVAIVTPGIAAKLWPGQDPI